MTNARHFLIREDGRVESLEGPSDFWVYDQNATEEEQAEAKQLYVESNQRIAADLRQRGLLD